MVTDVHYPGRAKIGDLLDNAEQTTATSTVGGGKAWRATTTEAITPTGGGKAWTDTTVATTPSEDSKRDRDQSLDSLDMASVVGDRKSKRAKKLTAKGNDAYYKNRNDNNDTRRARSNFYTCQ